MVCICLVSSITFISSLIALIYLGISSFVILSSFIVFSKLIAISFFNLFNLSSTLKFGYILGKKPNKNIKIKDYGFDFDKFSKEINLDFLETGITQTFQNQICNLAFVYGFDEMDMAGLYSESIKSQHSLKSCSICILRREMGLCDVLRSGEIRERYHLQIVFSRKRRELIS